MLGRLLSAPGFSVEVRQHPLRPLSVQVKSGRVLPRSEAPVTLRDRHGTGSLMPAASLLPPSHPLSCPLGASPPDIWHPDL